MNKEDLSNFIISCEVETDPNGYVQFNAHVGKDEAVKKFVEDNHLNKMTMSEFMDFAGVYKSSIQTKNKMREMKIKNFMNKSPKDIAQLSLAEQVDIIETIFYYGLTTKELKDMYTNNGDKLKALLYHIKLPKEFWNAEEKKADRFVALVANNKKITDSMRNWKNLSTDDKKATILETVKLINYAYHTTLDVGFYTSEEYRKSRNLDNNTPVHSAYRSCNKIFFNVDSLENSDNYMGVSVVFHEFMHKKQTEQKDPLINRLFRCNVYSAVAYEDKNIDSNSKEYGDLYSLMPEERFPYALQKYVENEIANKTGIEKTQAIEPKGAKRAHEKSFGLALKTTIESRS